MIKRGLTCILVGWSLLVHAKPIRILPLGDSITHGYGNGISILNSYRKTLRSLLSDAGYEIDFVGNLMDGDFADNQHDGHDGWYADHATKTNTILSHIAGWMTSSKPDAVLLHIGTNDIIDEFANANEVSLILDEIFTANSNATVVLALIINARMDFTRRADITTYNSNLNIMAQTRISDGDDIIVVDMETGASIDYTSADMADPYHPSQLGYDKMGTNWYPGTIAAINRQRLKNRPRINGISVVTNTLLMDLSNLCTGQSTSIEQAGTLDSNTWTNVHTFIPSTSSTNWTHSITGSHNTAFYRIIIE